MNLIVKAQKREPTGTLELDAHLFPCALGPSGLVETKREGDGGTPIASMRLLEVLFREDRLESPQTALPIKAISPDDGWCDDPASKAYNSRVSLPHPDNHEKLWRDDHVYDICVVLDWNIDLPISGHGSAIFFHLAHEDYKPTEGCIAISLEHMREVLKLCAPGSTLTTIVS